jgi:hypothetical protein
MMRPVGEVKVYLHREPIDMRKGRNGLAALVREGMQHDPFASEALYVFVGRRYDALKILGWDRNGFCVWWKAPADRDRPSEAEERTPADGRTQGAARGGSTVAEGPILRPLHAEQ